MHFFYAITNKTWAYKCTSHKYVWDKSISRPEMCKWNVNYVHIRNGLMHETEAKREKGWRQGKKGEIHMSFFLSK